MIRARDVRAVFFLALIVVCGCGKEKKETKGAEERGGDIVRVGGAVLKSDDIKMLVPQDERIPLTLDERREFVRRWVDTEILYEEAIRRNLKSDSYVQARLKELEHEFLADYLVFSELRKRTRVTDDEIEAYFANHEREYTYEYHVRQILVSTAEEAEQARELLKTKSFAWVANHYSVDPVTKRGGDLGYLTEGNMIPELEAVVFGMKPGDVTGIIHSDFGYHIFKLEDVREALVPVRVDDVREQIMNTLMLQKRKKAYAQFLDSLKATAKVDYRDPSYRPQAGAPRADTLGGFEGRDTTMTP